MGLKLYANIGDGSADGCANTREHGAAQLLQFGCGRRRRAPTLAANGRAFGELLQNIAIE
jgi:hypothetical protein